MDEQPGGLGPDALARARWFRRGRTRWAVGAALAVVVGVLAASTAWAGAGTGHDGYEGALFDVPVTQKVVALSFDDGPDPRWTPHVLDLLRAHDAHATFFLVGEHAKANRGLVADVLADGNEVGNHTYDHAHLPDLSRAEIRAEIRDGERAIVESGAPAPTLFRPPIGLTDERVAAEARAAGLRPVFWRLCVEHYVNHRPVPAGVQLMLDRVRPGMILLAHDGGIPDRSRTMDALPALLDGLAARGYRVVTVGELERLGIGHK